MPTEDELRVRAAVTYNAAADFFDDPANSFWDRFGRRTIERLGLRHMRQRPGCMLRQRRFGAPRRRSRWTGWIRDRHRPG